jgi:hypothetical protein
VVGVLGGARGGGGRLNLALAVASRPCGGPSVPKSITVTEV